MALLPTALHAHLLCKHARHFPRDHIGPGQIASAQRCSSPQECAQLLMSPCCRLSALVCLPLLSATLHTHFPYQKAAALLSTPVTGATTDITTSPQKHSGVPASVVRQSMQTYPSSHTSGHVRSDLFNKPSDGQSQRSHTSRAYQRNTILGKHRQ